MKGAPFVPVGQLRDDRDYFVIVLDTPTTGHRLSLVDGATARAMYANSSRPQALRFEEDQ